MKPKCADHATCPGSEPFYVGHFSQVTTEKHGYAPAYCLYCPDFVSETVSDNVRCEPNKIAQETLIRSIENRRDLQEHFKLHHTLDRKRTTRTKKYD